MNKKGQSLITFVLLLPLIIFFLGFIIDISLMYLEKTKVEGIVYDNINIALNKEIKDEEKIKAIIMENDDNLNVIVKIIDDNIKINVSDNKKSLFGNLIKLDIYSININYCANYLDKEIKKC